MKRETSRIFISFSLAIFLFACNKTKDSTERHTRVFQLLDTEETGVDFINTVEETKELNMLTFRNFFNGGGVAVGDINNDGLPDLYFTSNQHENKLYLNKGNLRFEDITAKAGVAGGKAWATGVSMADVNADGLLDIYVCNVGNLGGGQNENELFINNGDLTFTEKASVYNLDNAGFSTHAAFFDYDMDGDLDCYILNNSFKDPGKIELYRSMREIPDQKIGDKLMRNDGDTFTDVTTEAGIYGSAIGFGLGVSTGDVNNDGWPDLYISNDFWERDYLYINQGNGTFKEDLPNRTDLVSTSSMGADMADLNGDGSPEIFTTDMLAAEQSRIQSMMIFEPYHIEDLKYRANYHYQYTQNCLQLNNGSGEFQEIANLAGVAATDWSWGSLIFDFQNDGFSDIFVANGIKKDILDGDFREFMDEKNQKEHFMDDPDFDTRNLTKEMPSTPTANYAFTGDGNLKFQNKNEALGLGKATFTNGSVYADLDGDGDLELILNNNGEPASIYKNLSTENKTGHFLTVRLHGSEKNPFGIGCKIMLESHDRLWAKENYTNRGFQSSVEPLLHFGLGQVSSVEKLTVIWPDGQFQKLENVATDQKITLSISDAAGKYEYQSPSNFRLKDITREAGLTGISHTENNFNDFNQEILLNRMLSTESPRLAKSDVNRDGKEDFIMLGAAGDQDKLFIQTASGKFVQTNTAVFERDRNFESTCATFLDFEGDGDQDLLIGAGSNEYGEAINFIIRLYINDGKGNFEVDPGRIPPVVGNFSTLEAADINGDGYTDLFVGGRCVVGSYGLRPRSFLLKNNGGAWQDITPDHLKEPGMITDAVWSDVDKDGRPDLILVGDWMSVSIFKNQNGLLQAPETIPNSSGWWTRIEAADLDGDGNEDFVLGNWGLNSKFQTSPGLPITMDVADFDDNGKSEFIINWKAPDNNELYPWPSRFELTSQVPSLKKESVKFSDYGRLKMEDLFPGKEAIHYTCSTLSSSILWNRNGKMELQTLPLEAQLAPNFGLVVQDFDKDQKPDILLCGNFYGTKPQVGRHAASRGLILYQRNNSFESVSLDLSGQFRDAIRIGDKIILARNNGPLIVLK